MIVVRMSYRSDWVYFNMGCGRMLEPFLCFLDCRHEMYIVENGEAVLMDSVELNSVKENYLEDFGNWVTQ